MYTVVSARYYPERERKSAEIDVNQFPARDSLGSFVSCPFVVYARYSIKRINDFP